MRRVAVTGLGTVSPLGNSPESAYEQARAGRSAIRRLDTPFAARLNAPLAAPVSYDLDAHFDVLKLRMLDRFSLFALAAARQAVAQAGGGAAREAGPTDRARIGVFVGTGMGGTVSMDEGYQTLYGEGSDRIKPLTILLGMHNAAAAWIGIEHGVQGPSMTYSTACSSSSIAIGEAWQRVARGELEMAIAGGAEAPLSNGSMKAWEALHTLASVDADDASSSCKPFSRNRSGMVLGEGAAMLVLEPWDRAHARGARILGEVLGFGVSTDSGHITRPTVAGQAAAMHDALRCAGIQAEEIDAINTHGTGTQANDATETDAIKSVFGERAWRLPLSATKAVHGHLLGAAGALEGLLSLVAMQHGVVLPTMHLQQADPQCDLDYVAGAARDAPGVRTMLSNSFAFGGTNTVLVLRAAA